HLRLPGAGELPDRVGLPARAARGPVAGHRHRVRNPPPCPGRHLPGDHQMNTSTAPWLIVALREVETKLKDKAFVLSTLGTLALIIGAVAVNGFLGGKSADYSVA